MVFASDLHPDLSSALKAEGILGMEQVLLAEGVRTVEDFAWLSVDELCELAGETIDEAVAARIIMRLRAPFIQE